METFNACSRKTESGIWPVCTSNSRWKRKSTKRPHAPPRGDGGADDVGAKWLASILASVHS